MAHEPNERDPLIPRTGHRGGHAEDAGSCKALEQASLPSGARFYAIIVTLMLSCFLAALDTTIVATAIPAITDTFQSLSDVGWYGSVFFLTQTTFQATWGKAYGFYDLRTTLAVSIVVFLAGCVASAAAPSSAVVIAGRAIAGIGASGILGGVFTVIAFITDDTWRPVYMGIVGTTFGVASVVGPLLGGLLTSTASWRWMFWINLPIGGFALVALFVCFQTPKLAKDAQRRLPWTAVVRELDFTGNALVTAAAVLYLLAMEWGGTAKPWSSPPVVLALVFSGILTVALCLYERAMGDRALIPSRLFTQWPVWPNCIYTFFVSGVYFPLLYFLPIYFQAVQGVSPAVSAVRNIPLILGVSVFSIASTSFIGRTGLWKVPLVAGGLITLAGSVLLCLLDSDSTTAEWIGFQTCAGIGIGTAMEVPLVANQRSLPLQHIAATVGLTMFFELAGGVVFISAAQAIFANGLLRSLKQTAPNLDGLDVLHHGALRLGETFGDDAPAVLEAYINGFHGVFAMSLACAVVPVLVSLIVLSPFFSPRRKSFWT
ncbi:major facilitator superfamily protein [Hirsutella rhossiliensis]|uniref:Major facilitator superfamily domain-containing protein n=1 Tax=Hirsutella rhossiliensis TaxID=111463 RepID=A0A9P8N7K4_9HYPO|nr:major facilitator superfamily domain-containing protein [Hirsutella rhossiliensis]KAH0968447.1 major facilitator superfamily domain-containing protein [Hirsutella rhossiliensis]